MSFRRSGAKPDDLTRMAKRPRDDRTRRALLRCGACPDRLQAGSYARRDRIDVGASSLARAMIEYLGAFPLCRACPDRLRAGSYGRRGWIACEQAPAFHPSGPAVGASGGVVGDGGSRLAPDSIPRPVVKPPRPGRKTLNAFHEHQIRVGTDTGKPLAGLLSSHASDLRTHNEEILRFAGSRRCSPRRRGRDRGVLRLCDGFDGPDPDDVRRQRAGAEHRAAGHRAGGRTGCSEGAARLFCGSRRG